MTRLYPYFPLFILLLVAAVPVKGQTLLSSFDWELTPTHALVGPNATTASSSAYVDINGARGPDHV